MEKLIDIKNLRVDFELRSGRVRAVRDVSLVINKGERLGIVGESGAGKSVLGFSLINLISKPGKITGGEILFDGRDLTKLNADQMRHIRGNDISMIFQDPMMTLNPVLTIGTQMKETILAHMNVSDSEAEAICLDKLRKVYIPSPEKRLKQYPHEFSGGMRQRIVIAISLLTSPKLIIADEPTTALDVTIQAEIMDLLLELCEKENMGLILITHDLAVVSEVTQRIAVLYAGKVVELGAADQIISNPQHPYTQGLIQALPQMAGGERRLNQIPGMMPSLKDMPKGCPFQPRCTVCSERCKTEIPKLIELANGTQVACFRHEGGE
ncbi:MAG: ABC transporter ATP-binding protein [Pseudodesulfovibrio sp.]|uniref:Methionine ABC transporter ATP-binding protein n=1 Tax=Pseudodesulfovibrio indicus TaxID=1716143 RepID=A0A126QN03_9BACT|nr:ABC transporter ATP-binding protein [Pseudodesulfovibrio indicus]AMK11463.1 methionine ABC transporter ATP-binding protein [Pseudodesulfovibrio indicus]TDT89859.1 peptide/nickel transport system ATP-binding protein [Pseudodesulfovibrio indicus]